MKTMKFFIAVLLCLSFIPAKAQWRLGAEAGIDLSSVNVITNHTQVGSNGGIRLTTLLRIILIWLQEYIIQ